MPCRPGPSLASEAGAVLEFTPGFAGAFRASEGSDSSAATGETARRETPGTQLVARFQNLPASATLWVQTKYTEDRPASGIPNIATLIYAENAATTAEFTAIPIDTDGTATAIWEVTQNNPNSTRGTFFFKAALSYEAGQAALGIATVSGNLGPILVDPVQNQAMLVGDFLDIVPRFADTNDAYQPVLAVNACTTALLFPFVTSVPPAETLIAITNASMDIKLGEGFYLFSGGTTPAASNSGRCTLFFFSGSSSPASQTSAPIAAGSQSLFLLSAGSVQGDPGIKGVPNFRGYMVAQCDFDYGYGFAYLAGGSDEKGGIGYHALVLNPSSGFEPIAQ